MKAIMVMFDSLNRHMLPSYGCDWIVAPNFKRLSEKSVSFDNCYVGSMPCMPARRELHTGRYNFLHRSWGPLEPFDDSMPELLKKNGVYSHLISDHQHYWEDGGATYHSRYSSWEIVRGQEGDPWKGHVKDPNVEATPFKFQDGMRQRLKAANMPDLFRQDTVNREYMVEEEDMPSPQVFKLGLEFIEKNLDEDNWFLQIESFDPHEPFFASKRFRDLYPDVDYSNHDFDWPPYAPVNESSEVVEHGKKRYAALLSMCDYYLGQVLDAMDKYNMWEDTLLIVNTDHGYLLGEHGWWSKSVMPTYNEIAHIPLFVYDPRYRKVGESRNSLVQTIDIAPTVLEFFGLSVPKNMQGLPLGHVIKKDNYLRDALIFGYHGGHVNVTDSNHVYMRGPVEKTNTPLFEYTLMPTHMRSRFDVNELQDIKLCEPFSFTKNVRLMKIEAKTGFSNPAQFGSKLFDIENDPGQTNEIDDISIESMMVNKLVKIMKESDSPKEQFIRLGIDANRPVTEDDIKKYRVSIKSKEVIKGLEDYQFSTSVFNQLKIISSLTSPEKYDNFVANLLIEIQKENIKEIDEPIINRAISSTFGQLDEQKMIIYFINNARRVH